MSINYFKPRGRFDFSKDTLDIGNPITWNRSHFLKHFFKRVCNPELIINKGAELSKPLENSSFKITKYDAVKPLGVDNTKVVIPNNNKPITPPKQEIDPRFIL